MNSQLREQAINLRTRKELSYGEIRKKLGVSKSTLSYWLREFPLSEDKILELRRLGWQKGEISRERFRNTMRKKRELADLKIYETYKKQISGLSRDSLFVAGLMLYLGEGDKRNNTRIVLANTDHRIIKFFIKWIVDFLDVRKDDIRIQLHLYENMDRAKEKNFWDRELNLKEHQFYKTQVRKLQKSSFSYAGSHRHGTCSMYVLGVEKKRKLMMAIQAFLDQYLGT